MKVSIELQLVHEKIRRGRVWCTACGRSFQVDPAKCFQNGWPKHCGYTMTIDSPEEQAVLSKEPSHD